MKTIKSNKIIIWFCAVFMLTSCNDDLYEINYPPEYPLQSTADLDRAVKGVYRYMYAEAWNGGISNDAFMNHTGDDVRGVDNPSALQGDAPYFYLWKNWATEENSFSNLYRGIALCNEVIDFIEESYSKNELPFKAPTASELEKIKKNCDRVKGEMHFLRALQYHLLARMFCPPYISADHSNNKTQLLPYKIHLDKTVSGNKNPKIATVQEIYDLMVTDLITAKEYLPKSYDAAVHDVSYKEGRSTHWAAAALLARIYFYRRDWVDCEKECTYVIDNGPFTLNGTEPLDAWIKNYGTPNSSEVIYEFASTREQGGRVSRWTSQAKNWYNPKNGGRFTGLDGSNNNGAGYWGKSQWTHVVWSYSGLEYVGWWNVDRQWNNERGTDIVTNYTVLPEALRDKRYTQLNYRMEADPTPEQLQGLSPEQIKTMYPDSMYMKQWDFPNPYLYCDKYYRAPDGEYSKVPYIRLPELLLNRAIIKKKFNVGNADPLKDVNEVRNRAGLEALTSLNEDDIHKERMKEMFMEVGDRRFYLQALNYDIPVGDRDSRSYSPIKSPYSANHIPLPLSEITNNDSYKELDLPNQF